jgi:hypothetical protein
VLEKLLIPLIHWLLLCYLPIWGMRHFRWSAFGAGCGQWFMTTRSSYLKLGGHAAVKSSFHDGLTLPRAYRRAGFFTDICDATHLATCRMYSSAEAVWLGLVKNACEGMASKIQIGFWTVVLLCGQVLPVALLIERLTYPPFDEIGYLALAAVAAGLVPRVVAALRYRQSWLGVFCHPAAICLLLAVQWDARMRALLGRPVGWKGRSRPTPG